jgi:hypothetical protein
VTGVELGDELLGALDDLVAGRADFVDSAALGILEVPVDALDGRRSASADG